MSAVYLFGCGCLGHARMATAKVYATQFQNFKAAAPNPFTFHDPIFYSAERAFQKSYRTRTTVRTAFYGGTYANHEGTWTETVDVYTGAVTGTGAPGIGFGYAPTYSSDGTEQYTLYDHISGIDLGGDVVNETITLSSEYTIADMESDVDAIIAAIDWTGIGVEVRRDFSYSNPGDGSIVYGDGLISSPAEDDSLFQVGSYFFANGLKFEKQIIKCGVTTLWRIQRFSFVDPSWQFGQPFVPADHTALACATSTDTQCSPPHEITISIPTAGATSPEKYVGQNVLTRMKACGD